MVASVMMNMNLISIAAPLNILAEENFFHRMFFNSRGASTFGGNTDDMFMWLWWFCVIWFVFLMALMFYFVVKYRRRKGKIALPSSSHNTPLEVAWTVIPTLMLVYIFFAGFKGYMNKMITPGEAIELNLTGQQWAWSLTYPNGAETTTYKTIGAKSSSPVFYVPADVPIRLRMNSSDVMHAFWIPDFRFKQDVLPNRYTTIWFEATLPEKHELHVNSKEEAKAAGVDFIPEIAGVPYVDHIVFCAEYCGDEHAEMAATIRVIPYDAWQRWLGYIEVGDPSKPLVEVGEQVWKTKCASCHSVDGGKGTGPTWKDAYGTVVKFVDGGSAKYDANYVRESILYPTKHLHEGYGPNMALIALKERQIEGVIAYLRSISSNTPADERVPDAPTEASTDAPAAGTAPAMGK